LASVIVNESLWVSRWPRGNDGCSPEKFTRSVVGLLQAQPWAEQVVAEAAE